MALQESLTYAFDENSVGLLRAMRALRAPPLDRLVDLPEVGCQKGMLDADVFARLGRQGRFALIVRDGQMLEPLLQREAWLSSHVSLFVLAGWGQLPLFELVRRFAFLWPEIKARAEERQGAAWRIKPASPDPPANTFRVVTGRHAGG